MKTKIFVPSEANMDLIKHSNNIEAILAEIKFSEFESYQDTIELSPVSFYSRVNLDKLSKPEIVNPNVNQIRSRVKEAVSDGYERILFITSDLSYESFGDAIDQTKKDFEIGISIYNGKTYGYPLAYMALMADKAFTEGAEFSKVLEVLDQIRDNSKLFVFKPKKYKRTIFEKTFIEMSKIDGDLYASTEDGFVLISKDSKLLPFQNMISMYCRDIVNRSVIPFVLYGNKNQELIYTAIDAVRQVYDKIKTIDTYPLPICFSALVNANSDTIVLGYTQKIFKEMYILEKKEDIEQNTKETKSNELTLEELSILDSIPNKVIEKENEEGEE